MRAVAIFRETLCQSYSTEVSDIVSLSPISLLLPYAQHLQVLFIPEYVTLSSVCAFHFNILAILFL